MPGAPKKAAKGRLDKYYYMAKEQGLRSRAAFKLVQLEKKYQFLEKATGVLDLCAAPGGWMQIANKTTKPGTPIIGIDLDAIKPIPGCVGIVGDITTPKARVDIKAELKGKPCSVVLHDGAPNVGLAWAQDAFTQNELVLHSLKLATDVLSKGGVFVTKVFRSKDYNSLLWIFKQLFTKVEATKPPASRGTSAEIFVVCRDFLAPKKIDPKLLDFRYVFKEFEDKTKLPSIFSKDHSKKAPREGYDTEENPTLFKRLSAHEFVTSKEAVRLLGEFNLIEFIDEPSKEIKNLKCTKEEIKILCSDLRVCSKGDYRNLLRWKDHVNKELEKLHPDLTKVKKEEGGDEEGEEDVRDEKEIEIDEMEELETSLTAAQRKEKREKKKKLERRRKLQAKIDLKMVLPDDEVDQEEIELFSLNKIQTDRMDEIAEAEAPDYDIADEIQRKRDDKEKQMMDAYLERSVNESINENNTNSRIDRLEEELDIWYAGAEAKKANPKIIDRRGKKIKDKSDPELDMTMLESYKKLKEERTQTTNYIPNVSGEVMVDEDEEDHPMREDSEGEEDLSGRESEGEYEDEEDYDDPEFVKQKFNESHKTKNKLIVEEDDHSVDLLTKRSIAWYSQDMFHGLDEEVEEEELKQLERNNKLNKAKNNQSKKRKSRDDSDDEDGLGVGQLNRKEEAAKTRNKESRKKKGKLEDEEGFEEVPMGFQAKEEEEYGSDVDPEDQEKAMMLATMLKRDKKLKDELIDGLYNRYAWDDDTDDLPIWFQHEEKPHNAPTLPITKEIAQEIKDKLKELHARPIKKVAEARARKKIKATRKMEKAKAKAEVVASNVDMSNADKSKAIEQIYRKNMKDLNKKKNFNYIVASKGRGATGQPVGKGKGPIRVVDTRQKKDKRATKNASKSKKRR